MKNLLKKTQWKITLKLHEKKPKELGSRKEANGVYDEKSNAKFHTSHQVPQFYNYGMQVPASSQESSNESGKTFYQF